MAVVVMLEVVDARRRSRMKVAVKPATILVYQDGF